jgi:16S rRNA (uracil1498-N3)-methyltransferase
MRHRFHTIAPLVTGASLALSGEEAHHAKVLRLREGEAVELFDGRGGAFAATVEPSLTSVLVGEPLSPRESPLRVEMAMSIINLEKFELVLQKATELGVAVITPILTERMEVRAERFRGKGERWRKIIFEAVKQCGRASTPLLNEPLPFDDAVAREGVKVIYDADESADANAKPPAMIFIGPEGGFSPRELALARARGCAFATLGPRRLRAETAAIVAAALVQSRYGDL